MPLPLILGVVAAVAGAAGVGLGIHGGMKMSEANDTIKAANRRNEENNERLKSDSERTCEVMDRLGKEELEILASFDEFSELFEKIKNKPKFDDIKLDKVKIPKFDANLQDVSIGASLLLGGLSGAAAGTAGGFAAAGATTSAVMALGTASTGTAISTLSGVAATNATLAALGGGSLAAGGGGVALGTTILGATTLGVGLLVGGVIFSLTGSSLSDKADKVWSEMLANEEKINKVCDYLQDLKSTAMNYFSALCQIEGLYQNQLGLLRQAVEAHESNCDYKFFNPAEKLCLKNTVSLVHVLYAMCKVKLAKQNSGEDAVNEVNHEEINNALELAWNVEKSLTL